MDQVKFVKSFLLQISVGPFFFKGYLAQISVGPFFSNISTVYLFYYFLQYDLYN